MIELIDAAQSEVLFENFIFAADETGRRFADALSTATQIGVDVRVLYMPTARNGAFGWSSTPNMAINPSPTNLSIKPPLRSIISPI